MDGLITTFEHLDDGGMIIKNSQNCDPIAEACKFQQAQGYTGTGDFKFAGRIPDVMVEAYMTANNVTYREIVGNDEHIKRMMNDPAMAHFRVWKGRL